MTDLTKICSRSDCPSAGLPQPFSNFYKHHKHVYFAECKTCNNKRNRDYREKNSDGVKATQKKWYDANRDKKRAYCKTAARKNTEFKYRYGITLEQKLEMERQQGGSCKVCLKTAKLFVDHCHTTKTVRGLLCDNCNKAIGLIYDDTNVAFRLANYLKEQDQGSRIQPEQGCTRTQ